jgi:hypothetical protein
LQNNQLPSYFKNYQCNERIGIILLALLALMIKTLRPFGTSVSSPFFMAPHPVRLVSCEKPLREFKSCNLSLIETQQTYSLMWQFSTEDFDIPNYLYLYETLQNWNNSLQGHMICCTRAGPEQGVVSKCHETCFSVAYEIWK